MSTMATFSPKTHWLLGTFGMLDDFLLTGKAAGHKFPGASCMTQWRTRSRRSSDPKGFSKTASRTQMSKILKPLSVMVAGDILRASYRHLLMHSRGLGLIDRVCPGQYIATRSLWAIVCSVLSTFDIAPPLDKSGKPVQLQANMTNGLISYVSFYSSHNATLNWTCGQVSLSFWVYHYATFRCRSSSHPRFCR